MANLASNSGIPVNSSMEEMRIPLALSAFIHLALILFAIFGLHLLPEKPLDIPQPISISMVNPSDISRTTHVDVAHEEKEPPTPEPSKAPEPPKESQSSAPPPPPVEQKVETPPEPPQPPPPPTPAPPEKPLPKLQPVPKADTSFQQPAQLPQLQKPVKITTPPPPQQKPAQKQTKQVDQDFDSLLTNLAPAVPKADQISKDKPVKSHRQASAQASLSDAMSADEKALIHDRLKQCWIIPPGGIDSGITVQIVALYNQDKTLNEALISGDGAGRYNSDPLYRALADSAIRALKNPICNPLPLPDGKFDDWQQLSLNFDPKND